MDHGPGHAVAAIVPFLTDAEANTKIATAAIYVAIGATIASLISGSLEAPSAAGGRTPRWPGRDGSYRCHSRARPSVVARVAGRVQPRAPCDDPRW